MTTTHLWNNFFLLILIALVIEVAVTSIFSIKYLNAFLDTNLTKSIKNLLVLLIAVGLCVKVPQLRIFYKAKVFTKGLDVIHLILTALVLARVANIFHDWFSYLKKRSKEISG